MDKKRVFIILFLLISCKVLFSQKEKFDPFSNSDFLKLKTVSHPNYLIIPPIPERKITIPNVSQTFDSTKLSKEDFQRFTAIFGDYIEFQYKFLDLALNNELPDLGLPKASPGPPSIFHKNMDGTTGFSMTSPISLLYNAFSKEERSKRKAFALEAFAPIRKKINAKYNYQNIERWTGLKNDQLTKFVLYCNFDDNFLADISEYDLIVVIDLKLKEFIFHNDSCNIKF